LRRFPAVARWLGEGCASLKALSGAGQMARAGRSFNRRASTFPRRGSREVEPARSIEASNTRPWAWAAAQRDRRARKARWPNAYLPRTRGELGREVSHRTAERGRIDAIERRYTTDGQSPYATSAFRLRRRNPHPDGSVVFSCRRCEIPAAWRRSPAACCAEIFPQGGGAGAP